MRVSPHYHAIVLDGVYTNLGPGRTPRFCPIDPPTDEEVARLVRTVRNRVRSLLRHRGLLADDLEPEPPEDPSLLDLCQAAAVQGRIALGPNAGSHPGRMRRCPETSSRPPSPLSAVLDGFSLHGGVAIGHGETARLERLQPNYDIFGPHTVAFHRDDHTRRASVARGDGAGVAYPRLQRSLRRA